jgi:hypothetical protein
MPQQLWGNGKDQPKEFIPRRANERISCLVNTEKERLVAALGRLVS